MIYHQPFTVRAGSQKKYCNQWNVKCNLNETKVMVLKKKEGKLKGNVGTRTVRNWW
jgi:hypothetical protein